jgi:hypothetical protein
MGPLQRTLRSRSQTPLSTGTRKRFKQIEIEKRKGIQKCNFNELLKMRATNGGKAKRGDIVNVVKIQVNRQCECYKRCLRLHDTLYW